VGERTKKGMCGGEAVSDYSAIGSVTISFFIGMSQWKRNFPGEEQ